MIIRELRAELHVFLDVLLEIGRQDARHQRQKKPLSHIKVVHTRGWHLVKPTIHGNCFIEVIRSLRAFICLEENAGELISELG
jgi:hypothetical protein